MIKTAAGTRAHACSQNSRRTAPTVVAAMNPRATCAAFFALLMLCFAAGVVQAKPNATSSSVPRPLLAPAQQPAARATTAVKTATAPPARCDPDGYKPKDGKPLLYLYVWAGVENAVGASALNSTPGANTAKDFVATIDVTSGSPCFGKVIHEADVPTSGNEPHHVGLNINATVLGVGGFNSWRYKQPSMYFFDVKTNPAEPRFIKSVTPQHGATTDDFFRLPNGGFLVSLMGNTSGGSPGRVAELDAQLNLIAEHPRNASANATRGFNPHGLALAPPSVNRMVTLDYVEYASTFKPSTSIKYRTTARIWDTAKREVIKVVDLGDKAKGLMTARYIPNGKAQFLITAGHGVLYVLDALAGTVKQVYDFKVGDGHCVLSVPFKNATRVLLSIYTSDQVQLLDIANPDEAKLLQNLDLPAGTGPHATVLAGNERLLAVSTYYVKHDFGRGVAPPFTVDNERSVRLYSVAEDGNSFKPHPSVPLIDFKTLFPHKGVARPHGMAFKPVAV